MVNESRLVDLFLDLVRIDSPSFCESNVAHYLRSWAESEGYPVTVDNAGDSCGGNCGNLVVTIPPTGKGDALAFAAHMDCVVPCIGVVPVVGQGIIKSGGDTVLGGDDKAGVAALIEAVRVIKEKNISHPEISLIFTIAEESGMHGAKAFEPGFVNASDIIVLDAEGKVGTLINKSPAKAHIDIEFRGKAAHAGMAPEAGISAIQTAAEAISRMHLLRIDEDTTANIGSISGGAATNIVAERVDVSAEARSMDENKLAAQIESMEQACEDACSITGGSFKFEADISYPSVSIPEDDRLIRRVATCCEDCGFEPLIRSTGGGSDANIFSGKGFSVLTLGIGMTDVHTVNETISIQSLKDTALLAAALMKSK